MKNNFFNQKILFDQLTPISLCALLREHFSNETCIMFESAVYNERGNFSFFFIGARERIYHSHGKSWHEKENGKKEEINNNPLIYMKDIYTNVDKDTNEKISKELGITFSDGFVGYIGYDAIKLFEPKLDLFMKHQKDDLDIPIIDLIRPKVTCVLSHKTNTLNVFTLMPSMKESIEIFTKTIQNNQYKQVTLKKSVVNRALNGFSLTHDSFLKNVEKIKEQIKDGDIFQMLLSIRFTQYANIDKLSFYRVLRNKNPSPYMFFLDYKDFAIIGSSPEVMVKLENSNILLRPIAGTRKRGKDTKQDTIMENELLSDAKELSEHLMLIDLGRNDLGKVSNIGSVKVSEMMKVERYSHVMHLVSTIESKLENSHDMFDLFMSVFTAGTMSGTPKLKAMELIASYENVSRSFYSGAVGYFGFDGNMDTAITIRTAYLDDEKIVFQAGAGVVADSKPELEYLEVQNKLKALVSTLDDLST